MRIKVTHEQYSAANNFTTLSSLPRSIGQIENTSEINNEFTEFMTTTSYYREDVFNDILSQNFTLNNGLYFLFFCNFSIKYLMSQLYHKCFATLFQIKIRLKL